MNVFTILPALMLGITTLLALNGLRGYHAVSGLKATATGGPIPGWLALAVTVQMIFGFFATAGLSCADWGRVARDAKDVRAGGWVGVFMAPWIVATLALLSTAGAAAQRGSRQRRRALEAGPGRYTATVETLVGGRLAGMMLLVFGLAALAPACYAAFGLTCRLHDTWPRVSMTKWTILGAGLAWLLVSSGRVNRMLDVFSLVGGLVAPAAGAIAADYVRSRGAWPGPRRGYNIPGLLAWLLGSSLALLPMLGMSSIQPAAVIGFVTAFLTFLVASGLGAGSAIEALPGTPPVPEITPAAA